MVMMRLHGMHHDALVDAAFHGRACLEGRRIATADEERLDGCTLSIGSMSDRRQSFGGHERHLERLRVRGLHWQTTRPAEWQRQFTYVSSSSTGPVRRHGSRGSDW